MLEKEIHFATSQEEKNKCESLLNFFKEEKKKIEQEHAESVSEKKDAVWKVEPMVKAIRRNNLELFCLLILLGGKLGANDFEYLVNRIEDESKKITEKRYLIKFLSKIKDQNDQNLLHHAADKGKLKCLKILIGCKLNANGRKTDEEQTSWLLDCINGETKCIQTLLENNVSVNAYSLKRKTPLHCATFGAHQECLELLVSKGADVNAKYENDWTPLHIAALNGNVNCLEVLLANTADANARDNKQETPIHFIGKSLKGSKEEKERCVEMLINAGADVNAKDKIDRTPLHWAAKLGKVDCLEVLLANGADANAKGEIDFTPLHQAASNGNVNCLEVLLENGADVNARTIMQWTLLHLIGISLKGSKAEKGRLVEMLINAGADINARELADWTPLHYAAGLEKLDYLEVLLANGADVNVKTKELYTPLHIIGFSHKGCKVERKRCAEMLINAGADVNAKCKDDATPLHYAAYNRIVLCLELLLANGADVNARNNLQKTPLHIIGISEGESIAEKEQCAEMLIKAGAVIDAKDKDGNTIFYHSFFQTLRVKRPDLFIKKTERKFI
jgi:ankyrin repeat protein